MRNEALISGATLRTGRSAEQGGEANRNPETKIDRGLLDHLLAQAGPDGAGLGAAVIRASGIAAAMHRSISMEVER